MQIAFNRQPTRTTHAGKFRQNEISPFFFKAAHIAEEKKIVILRLAFGYEPCPVRVRSKEFQMHPRIGVVFLAIKCGQRRPQLHRQQLH